MNALKRVLIVPVMTLTLAGCGAKPELPPILIGHVAPVSGVDRASGQHARQGVLLAVEEVNKDDQRIAGRRIEVLHPDCRPTPEAVRAVAVRLIAIDKVAALLGGTDAGQVESLVQGLSQIGETAKVPLVAPGGLPDRPANAFVFHTGVAPAMQGRTLARFASQKLAAKRVAVLVNAGENRGVASSARAGAFAGEFRKEGRVLGEWSYHTAAELKELTDRLKTTPPPDAVLVAGVAEDLQELRKSSLGEKTVWLLAGDEQCLSALRLSPIPNSVYLTTAFVADRALERTRDFVRKYQDRFKDLPDAHAALAYDSARFLFEGLRQAKGLEGSRVREALAELKTFESVTGPLSLDADHWANRNVFVVQVENGQAKTVAAFDPEGKELRAASLRAGCDVLGFFATSGFGRDLERGSCPWAAGWGGNRCGRWLLAPVCGAVVCAVGGRHAPRTPGPSGPGLVPSRNRPAPAGHAAANLVPGSATAACSARNAAAIGLRRRPPSLLPGRPARHLTTERENAGPVNCVHSLVNNDLHYPHYPVFLSRLK
jgi:branched-chain amino acid transport system substrate-binding protein